jgi:hypothetical protein
MGDAKLKMVFGFDHLIMSPLARARGRIGSGPVPLHPSRRASRLSFRGAARSGSEAGLPARGRLREHGLQHAAGRAHANRELGGLGELEPREQLARRSSAGGARRAPRARPPRAVTFESPGRAVEARRNSAPRPASAAASRRSADARLDGGTSATLSTPRSPPSAQRARAAVRRSRVAPCPRLRRRSASRRAEDPPRCGSRR